MTIQVDDSSMIRKMLVKMLLTLGCVVDEASDGQVAIAIIRDKLRMSFEKQDKTSDEATTMRMPYDLILMDSNMPVVSGPEATNTIVRKLGFANVVVGVTGSVLPTEVRGTVMSCIMYTMMYDKRCSGIMFILKYVVNCVVTFFVISIRMHE